VRYLPLEVKKLYDRKSRENFISIASLQSLGIFRLRNLLERPLPLSVIRHKACDGTVENPRLFFFTGALDEKNRATEGAVWGRRIPLRRVRSLLTRSLSFVENKFGIILCCKQA
jgi:hypothetical protein